MSSWTKRCVSSCGGERNIAVNTVTFRRLGTKSGFRLIMLCRRSMAEMICRRTWRCCLRCNLHKGTNLSGIDPSNGSIVTLFNPRREVWGDHFRLHGGIIVGLTPCGQATVVALAMNAPERVRLRESLLSEGILPLE